MSTRSQLRCFVNSTNWDETDDYAHHYLAFNLDIEGNDPLQVEESYTTAIKLDPRVSLWWARYVSFLVVRGRVRDAREAWTDAMEILFPAHSEPGSFIYDHLHVWVARLLLHRGHVEFAREVLDDVPPYVQSERIDALDRRLRALTEAEKVGAYAPGRYIEIEEWWRKGPFLLDTRDPWGEERLVRWLALRVDAIRENRIIFRGLNVVHGSSLKPELIRTEMTFDEFDRWQAGDISARQMEPGMFVEVGLYPRGGQDADDASKRIRVHPVGEWFDEGLPNLFPDPLRYLRKN